MAGRFQFRRGNTAQNNAFTGSEGEVTYDTQAKTIRIHDGVTPGGFPVLTLAAIFPDYTRKVSMTNPFTAPTYGFAMWNNSGTGACKVNGQTIAVAGNDSYNEGPAFVMLKPGDVLSFSADVGLTEFYPCSGA